MNDDPLDTELRALAADLDIPPIDEVATATVVMERIATAEAAFDSVPALGRAARLSARASTVASAVARMMRTRWRAVVAGLVAVLLAAALTPPVRAAVAEWFGLGGVEVRPGPAVPSAPPPPAVVGELGLDAAAGLVDFTPALPAALGEPDAVEVGSGRYRLSMSWVGADGTVRLDQFAGSLAVKFVPDPAEPVDLGAVDGLWFADPHALNLYGMESADEPEIDRSAGPTLVWMVGETTIRLEGVADRDRAAEIARSTLDDGT
ncbi:hypothetical protein [Phytoactinopolyspora endophytica]|uniref:hypothetical protein n=1 Tax=Phytoactinopolyspora endophytica TaxID=1642495 RepID=UPI00101D0C8D|nr:hypothetical protein [Phytoactinopolyspora endophytica]